MVDLDAIRVAIGKERRASTDEATLEGIVEVVAADPELFSKMDPRFAEGLPLHEDLFAPRVYFISDKDFSLLKLLAEVAMKLKAGPGFGAVKTLWSAYKKYREDRREFSGLPGHVLRALILARATGLRELETSLREDRDVAKLLDNKDESLKDALLALAGTEPPMVRLSGDRVTICEV